jgi:hypothetical protein
METSQKVAENVGFQDLWMFVVTALNSQSSTLHDFVSRSARVHKYVGVFLLLFIFSFPSYDFLVFSSGLDQRNITMSF